MEVIDSALDRGWSSTPRSGRLTAGTHCTRGWEGPKAGLEKRKPLAPTGVCALN